MMYNDYDFNDEGGGCIGYITVEDVKLFSSFDFTYISNFDTDGWADIISVTLNKAERQGYDLTTVFNDADVWTGVEDNIQADLETLLNSELRKQAAYEDAVYEAHKDALRGL